MYDISDTRRICHSEGGAALNRSLPDILAPTEESTRGCSWPAAVTWSGRMRNARTAPGSVGRMCGPRLLRALPRRGSRNPKIDSSALRPMAREEEGGVGGPRNDRSGVHHRQKTKSTLSVRGGWIDWRQRRALLAGLGIRAGRRGLMVFGAAAGAR